MEQSFHAFCVYRNPRLNFSNVARTTVTLAVSLLLLREKSWLEFMSDLFHLYRLPIKKRKNHIKARSKNMFCSESNGSQGGFHYR